MIQAHSVTLPHGITLQVRVTGELGRPVLMFLHGFPESAFVWDELMTHFAQTQNGGFRCVAPCMRGFAPSSAPTEIEAYRAKHLVQDVQALVTAITQDSPTPGQVHALVAHDWGGAIAWNVAALHPALLQRLVILNAPHAGTFSRDLYRSTAQQAASAYMNFLIRPDAAPLLEADDYRRLWGFFDSSPSRNTWLTETVRDRYRAAWQGGLEGQLHYYRASPLRPPIDGQLAGAPHELPASMLHVPQPTLVIWGMDDHALLPGLLDGLDAFVPDLRVQRLEGASHWLVHERPQEIAACIQDFIRT